MADGRSIKRGATSWPAVMIMLVSLGCLAACGNSGEPANQAPTNGQAKTAEPETVAWTINGQTFRLELALDDASRTQGLSDRKSIAEDGGMLFKFAVPRKTQFVMRRCYVPIDLIFIDDDGYIDSLHAMEVIEPVGGARWKNPSSGYPTAGFVVYAVELKGGKIAELGLKRGEKLELPDEVVQLKAQ